MKCRCLCATHVHYHRYGGRGITVCKSWQGENGFSNFMRSLGPRPNGMTLDRIDNDRGYEPANCKWSTWLEQANNTSNCRLVTAFGEIKSAAAWSRDKRCVIGSALFIFRLNKGVPPELAMTAHAGAFRSRLTIRAIMDIRRRHLRGDTCASLSLRYKVHSSAISRIVRNLSHKESANT